MFEVSGDEPRRAFLWDRETKAKNRYGDDIELACDNSELRGKSLHINDDAGIGQNPNRYKQHGFFFNADNCIGCHACESACSEKNDNPAHIAFRSVGFVEGGTYPAYQRINISMACNHCDDPVCLKGCPTRAYTKFAEYGAVLQDPDICFGCGYCTWVCPYNAPQLDPVKGEVSKCNMCVDRLEVGLKPACVAACLGNALDFGVIENIPENRVQCETEIPGFPRPDITRPNIRFQQTRSTHREMTRTDHMPIKYHRNDAAGKFEARVDEKHGKRRQWNWRKLLGSHEQAHVVFTLGTQAVIGGFLLVFINELLATPMSASLAPAMMPLLAGMLLLQTVSLYKLNMHLGKPHRFYRGFNNLRYSPVSREIAGVTLFFTAFIAYCAFSFAGQRQLALLAGAAAAVGGLAGVYFMYRIYRIKARPYWDHWQTATSFFGSMISLGALLVGTAGVLVPGAGLLPLLSAPVLLGLAIEALGHLCHGRDLKRRGDEGAASWYEQSTTYGWPWITRNVLWALGAVLAVLIAATAPAGIGAAVMWLLLTLTVTAAAIISRSLFFVLVIPTTMPGAFFWKNKGFEEHARATGLAEMEQVGVVYERHGHFKFNELIDTLKTATPKKILGHIKDIVVWKKVT